MKPFAFIRALQLALFVAVVAVSNTGNAVTVNYSVDGWGPTAFPASTPAPDNALWGPNGYPGDTVALQAFSGTLNLTEGTSLLKINTLLWTIDYTYGGTATDPSYGAWQELSFPFDLTRHMNLDGQIQSLSQGGLLECLYTNDYLRLSGGPTATWLIDGYKIDVTPMGLAAAEGVFLSDQNPWVQAPRDVMARFEVTRVPDHGNTLCILGLGLLAIGALRRKLSR